MTFEDIQFDVEPPFAKIILDRPNAKNAYSEPMVDSLLEALAQANTNPDVRAVILTGAGSAFSAGGDLKRMRDKTGMFAGDPVKLRSNYITHIQRIPRAMAQVDKPMIAAINGPAIGAGLDLACMCDFRIAQAKAKFGSTFVRLGLIPGDGGAYLLARTIGLPNALDLILTARIIDADEALRIGLVNKVVAAEQLQEEARTLGQQLAANAPLAVQLAKRAAYRSFDHDLETALELAATYQGVVQNSEDHLEGVDALLGKRKPDFKGR
ncbi:MAG: enoyl-CoA hydratase-related protein [Myxococcota bacterium]